MTIDVNDNLIQGSAVVATVLHHTGEYADQSVVKVSPVTGFSNTIPNGCSTYLIAPAGTLAAGTITMPAAPVPGQRVTIASHYAITSLTLAGNTSQTVFNAPTTLAADTSVEFRYDTTNWWRIR